MGSGCLTISLFFNFNKGYEREPYSNVFHALWCLNLFKKQDLLCVLTSQTILPWIEDIAPIMLNTLLRLKALLIKEMA